MPYFVTQGPDGLEVTEVEFKQLHIVAIPFAKLPLSGDTDVVYATENGWLRWEPDGTEYRNLGDEMNSAAAAWGAIGGTLAQQTDLQNILTTLAASVGTNTTNFNAVNNQVQDHESRLDYVESLVLSNSGSAPANSVAPTLTGTPSVGQALSVVPGTWSGTITSRTYTFRRGNTIVQADSAATSYTPQAADGGATITVTETVHSAFPDVSKTSIGYVVGAAPSVPVVTQAPFINGTAAVGQTGTFTRGSYSNTPTSYTQQWYRSGAAIAGATGTTYTYLTADAGLSITVREIAINGTGPSLPATSPAVVVSGGLAPTYDGGTPPGYVYQATYQVGTPMVGDIGAPLNNPDPTLYTYQHYRAGVAISGATSLSYTPVSADGAKSLSFGVIPRNASGAGAEERSAGVYVSP